MSAIFESEAVALDGLLDAADRSWPTDGEILRLIMEAFDLPRNDAIQMIGAMDLAALKAEL